MLVKFTATFQLIEKNVGGNFQRHFGCDRKMSVEISSDILVVTEKNARGNFQRHFSCDRKNVGGNFQRHFKSERKMSVEISSDIIVLRENCTFKTNVRQELPSSVLRETSMEISTGILLRKGIAYEELDFSIGSRRFIYTKITIMLLLLPIVMKQLHLC